MANDGRIAFGIWTGLWHEDEHASRSCTDVSGAVGRFAGIWLKATPQLCDATRRGTNRVLLESGYANKQRDADCSQEKNAHSSTNAPPVALKILLQLSHHYHLTEPTSGE